MENASSAETEAEIKRKTSTLSPTTVRYPVLLEAVEGGWIASILGVASYRAVGLTRAAALQGLEKVMRERLEELLPFKQEFTEITLPFVASENPWSSVIGSFKDDPLFDEMLEHIEDYRRELDAELSNEAEEAVPKNEQERELQPQAFAVISIEE